MDKKQDIDRTDTESIIVAGEKIIQRHTAMGPASPLNNLLIADLNSRISIARQKHDEGIKYKKLMDDAWRDRDHYLGGKDKSVQYTLQAITNILRQENFDLNEWGLK